MVVERTLFFVKPDGMTRELAGECYSRIERKGLKVVAAKVTRVTLRHAMKHYAEHEGKDFFDGLVTHVTSSPVLAYVFEGDDAIKKVRELLGSSHDPLVGTIRGDYAQDISRTIAHASDSPEAAAREIPLFFKKSEIIELERASGPGIHE